MKKFILGSASFPQFIQNGYAYVDKTNIIYNLINDTMGRQFFLSRPRRFGKSLLLSTIRCIFEGKRELFKGLKIDSLDWNWEETYPVLHINMNECVGNSVMKVKEGVAQQLNLASKEHNIKIKDKYASLNIQFQNFILDLAASNKNNQIILLLDEYDVEWRFNSTILCIGLSN